VCELSALTIAVRSRLICDTEIADFHLLVVNFFIKLSIKLLSCCWKWRELGESVDFLCNIGCGCASGIRL